MAKLVLDTAAMRDDFFDEAAFVGIVSAEPAYRFCWLLNNHFDINFIRDPEQNVSFLKKENKFHFQVYQCHLPNSFHKYLLYKLKDGGESLLPEIRQMDYLWLIQTANSEADAARIAGELKNIPEVQLTQILSIGQLKSANNLLV